MSRRLLSLCTGLAFALSISFGGSTPAAEPLHKQINQLIVAKAAGKAFRPQADDAEFVRRIYLDLAGRIPSIAEAREFLADKSADKRVRLVDTLLASPEYPRRMQELFNVILMERRGENPEWDAFLKTSFAANKPWDQLARELIKPDAANEAVRAAAWFQTRRLEKVGQQETDHPGLTRDIGRLLLGIDLQCAQCHNHLFIDEYKQVDFQGLYTVFGNTFIRTDTKFPAIGEKALTKKLEFVSVFDPTKRETGPRVPFGAEIELPPAPEVPADKKADKKKPDPNAPPAFSPLAALAEKLPTPENALFTRNMVNRLWFVMLGRGLVHPLDLHHGQNPPSHPEVLDLLAREFTASKFDMKALIRELALTDAYQRTTVLAGEAPPKESYRVANEKRLSAEQLLWSVLEAAGERDRLVNPGGMPQGTDKPSAEAKPADAKPADPKGLISLAELKKRFVKAFANPAKEPENDFNASVQGALFLLNDEQIRRLFEPRSGNLIDRASKFDDTAAVDEIYLSVLTRNPSDEERAEAVQFLAKRADRRPVALGQLAWALMSCMEFCVNH